jgi:PHD/YefM family antitoxin component YafN of YafNO toxin-antitoxin module
MNNTLTASDLKTKGISVVDKNAKNGIETIITVRGKEKYIIIPLIEFNRLRECELTAALVESENDLKEGKYSEDSIEAHLKRIKNA